MLLVFLDYFSFIKRLMELLRMFTRIRKIELEIQTINQSTLDADHPSRFFSPIFRRPRQRYISVFIQPSFFSRTICHTFNAL